MMTSIPNIMHRTLNSLRQDIQNLKCPTVLYGSAIAKLSFCAPESKKPKRILIFKILKGAGQLEVGY